MNKVNKAIIMAAGFGKRMRPITLMTPKPLIKVNGKIIIETIIDALKTNGIEEIYIVVGYLKEQFKYLESIYKNVKLIENKYYDTCNNISSLYVAREHIPNSIIIDGDQIIYNSNILNSTFEHSGYNCVWTEKETKEWVVSVNNGIISYCNRNGGRKGWQLFSISRWNEEDGARLKKHIEIEFEDKKNTQIYWDDVALFCYPNEYKLGIYEMQFGDVIEIDSFDELVDIDSSYMENIKEENKNERREET